MDAALEIHDYLPLAYPSAGEGEYIRFVWEAFESNYVAGKYQFAILAFHMLYMSYVYFSVWQIKQAKPEAFTHAVLFQQKEKELLTASSPFTFSEVNERSIFKFLRLTGCENQHIGKFQKLVDQRNEIAHPNGNIFFSDQATADQRIEEVMQQIRGIQTHMPSVLHACLLQFLHDSANPDEREIADSEVHVEINFLHKHYLSRKDIEACLACDLSEFDDSPFRGEVQALMQVLQTKAEE
ncbi:TPA: hypothetical protein NHS01_005088 [Pseudomonas aeruginosa]|uniref:hypothetical protein n=1 Tax=Stutzerimonas stutzeri TaxID=316 RepID=UPI002447AC71|nr:hypothetical protein [Stutzerimonas stutzeri]WGL62239.1 hypothetical protein QDX81_14675 [Pseudomonas sp. CW003PS]HCE6962883.1 hypothetical protein [Pseudomonas aeruginosa]MDH0185163.1 hypothetical protein [Stutzerimonas stutzeri]MDH1250336.1 hypothetical protein [Stutzerimonas stutzeri]MDH1671664.1 hypothetical protein [Stutzerimonas stutzeri]